MTGIDKRYDFVLLFDVKDGNPNGDPDAGNLPRLDQQTGHGIVTDVSLKRKVRNFVGLVKNDQPPFEIYVKEKAVLNREHDRAYFGTDNGNLSAAEKKKGGKGGTAADSARDWMCRNFYDIRAFGAVMTTDINAGQVRGPLQMTFGRSVEPIVALEHAITRMAVTNERDVDKERTMGRKFTVPYALYRSHGFVSSFLAKQTGFGSDDLELFWQALSQMFEHDRSAARGEMSTRGLYVFEHSTELGNAPAHSLFDRLVVASGAQGAGPARSFSAYDVTFDGAPVAVGQAVSATENVTLRRIC